MERRRPRRTVEEQEAAWLDMFRCLVLTAFFLVLLALLSLVLNRCSTPQTHQAAEPRPPRHPSYCWHDSESPQ
jgi:hypothetical protein